MKLVQRAAVWTVLIVILVACQSAAPAGFALTVIPPANGLVHEVVQIHARVTNAPFADGAHSWTYDFGDGATGLIGQGVLEFDMTHVYSEPGAYTITVTLQGQGQSLSQSAEITVQRPPSIPVGRLRVTAEPVEAITQGWTVWAYSRDSGGARTASCRITDQDERDCIERLQSLALELAPGEYEVSVFPGLTQDDPPGWAPRYPADELVSIFNAWRQVVTIAVDNETAVTAEFVRAEDAP